MTENPEEDSFLKNWVKKVKKPNKQSHLSSSLSVFIFYSRGLVFVFWMRMML